MIFLEFGNAECPAFQGNAHHGAPEFFGQFGIRHRAHQRFFGGGSFYAGIYGGYTQLEPARFYR